MALRTLRTHSARRGDDHLVYVEVDPAQLVELWKSSGCFAAPLLPPGAELVETLWDEERRCLRLILRSQSFASLLHWEPVPMLAENLGGSVTAR